nr:hypothetical protein [Kofleriaceae bacterium]
MDDYRERMFIKGEPEPPHPVIAVHLATIDEFASVWNAYREQVGIRATALGGFMVDEVLDHEEAVQPQVPVRDPLREVRHE